MAYGGLGGVGFRPVSYASYMRRRRFLRFQQQLEARRWGAPASDADDDTD